MIPKGTIDTSRAGRNRTYSRPFKNVQQDIAILERHGLVRISKTARGKRTVKVPRVPFEEIALKITI